MKKAQKQDVVKKLVPDLTAAKSVVFVDFAGMNIKLQQDLKKKLKTAGARMFVAKNTLLRRAGQEVKLPSEVLTDTVLTGQTAIVTTPTDPVSPIATLGKFIKEFEVPKFKVGVVEGTFTDKEALVRLSKLPGRDILLGQVLGALMAPSYGLVNTLQGNTQKLLYILNSKVKGGE